MPMAYKNTNALAKRWTAELIAGGFTALPTVLLQLQPRLGLSPLDFNIVAQLASYWREPSRLPYPSVSHLAECVGLSRRQLQRQLKSMEERGLITRQKRTRVSGGQTSNYYSLNGLIEKLLELHQTRLRTTPSSYPNADGSPSDRCESFV
jgi:predicted transcriptional regulator